MGPNYYYDTMSPLLHHCSLILKKFRSNSVHHSRFLIMATDGLWDCISNQEAVDFLKDKIEDPLFGAKALVQLVYKQGRTT